MDKLLIQKWEKLTNEELNAHLDSLSFEEFEEIIVDVLQDVIDRLEMYAKSKQMKQVDLNNFLRLGSSISSKKTKNNYGTDLIVRVAFRFPNLNLKWLMTGFGEMEGTYTPPEGEMPTANYSTLNEKEVTIVKNSELQDINNTLKDINVNLESLKEIADILNKK